ncbi:MAG: energy-coupling factor transporter transmembrane protein EcfT, partial [Treponema sp.]|nr:energy-coupling factor transporter transmembrane protein EcfT [Treponema sp.]
AFTLGNFTVTDGMVSLASILIKTTLSILAVLILIATTSFADLSSLLTAAKPVRLLGLQFLMTYRYISTLLDEADNMWTAYMLRAPSAKGIKMKDMGSFLGQLLLRSFDRSTRVYNAMQCRGFAGIYYSGTKKDFCRNDFLFVILTAAIFCALRFFNVSLFLGELFG